MTFKTIETDAKLVISDVHKALLGTEAVVEKLLGNPTVQATIQGVVTTLFGVQAGQLEQIGVNLLTQVGKALADSEAATTAKLKDLGLDENLISDIKLLVTQVKTIKL